ncbi:hypothetical protein ACOMHN_011264 [Nucella lapillus]
MDTEAENFTVTFEASSVVSVEQSSDNMRLEVTTVLPPNMTWYSTLVDSNSSLLPPLVAMGSGDNSSNGSNALMLAPTFNEILTALGETYIEGSQDQFSSDTVHNQSSFS